MTSLSTVENKISSTKKYLKICYGLKGYSRDKIENDINIRAVVERYLYLVVQSTIDSAESLVSYKNLRKPTTASECFEILKEEGLINQELSKKLTNMTGFRNILAHDYQKINYDIVYDVLHNGLKDIEEFLEKIN